MTHSDCPAPPAVEEERILWEGSPSPVIGWRSLTLSLVIISGAVTAWWLIPQYPLPWVLATIALGLIPGFWRWVTISSTRYQLTTERLITARGLLTREVNDLELYRVKDMVLIQPLLLRLCGCGHLRLKTSDFSNPTLELHAIVQARKVMDLMRQRVEIMRAAKGVHEVDVDAEHGAGAAEAAGDSRGATSGAFGVSGGSGVSGGEAGRRH